ncbi:MULTISPECIES: VOC family protein [Paraburkholderia]|uniref:VOC domain-containing protein n=1 Tax=Paraburkholderia metrosideri TaxID=580937 RepID=A0ABW9E6M4_9BURK
MISNLNILIPVEYDIYPRVVDFYRTALNFTAPSSGTSAKGNPWHCFQAPGVTLTIHTGQEGKFPYPEFRPTGHGIALAIEIQGVVEEVKRLNSIGIPILNEWDYGDGTIAISIADPAGNILEIWGRP